MQEIFKILALFFSSSNSNVCMIFRLYYYKRFNVSCPGFVYAPIAQTVRFACMPRKRGILAGFQFIILLSVPRFFGSTGTSCVVF